MEQVRFDVAEATVYWFKKNKDVMYFSFYMEKGFRRNVVFSIVGLMCWAEFGFSQSISFEEVSEVSGIDHGCVSSNEFCGGLAVFDFDNDGWEDLYVCGGQEPDKLYRNDGDGTFTDVTLQSGLNVVSGVFTFGVTTGDIDNDGYREILLTTFFGSENILLYNNGDGTFTQLPGFALPDDANWTSAASFGDVNNDGLLDIYLASYIFNSSSGLDHDCNPNFLFINNGDLTFTDQAEQLGVADEGCALAVSFTDYDNDRDMDILVVNDFGEYVLPNLLFQNQGVDPLSFVDVSQQSNMNAAIYGMGVAIGDYDRDGDLDYYMTNIGRNILYRNDMSVFTDVTTLAGVENDSANGFNATGWGTIFFDVDNDSWPDLFVANGLISADSFIETTDQDPHKLYHNDQAGAFTDVSDLAGVGSMLKGRGAITADFDKDGRLDLVVNNFDRESADSTQLEYFSNTTSSVGNWLKVKLTGVQSNRDAFGSHVTVWFNGEQSLMEVDGGSSHASQNTSILHFGLGGAEVADSVIARFPSGIVRKFENIAAGQTLQILEDLATQQSYQSIESPRIQVWLDDSEHLHVQNGVSFTGSAKLVVYDAQGRQIVNDVFCNGCQFFNLSLQNYHAVGLLTWVILDDEYSWSGKLIKSNY